MKCLAALLAGGALVLGTLARADEDIRDIRGPKSVLVQSWWLPEAVVGVVILVALCAFFIWRRRGRGVVPRNLTLTEQALERLEKTRPLMRPESAREFGIAASEVIRQYIEQRFNVVATQRTTEEFLQALLQGSNDTLARHRALLAQFLQQCDFVKFAGASLAMVELETLFQSARGFVLETGEPATT
jgi:HAMP domain-containing protein